MAPTLTILAPTHNRPDVLEKVWPTWLEQEGLAEIVVVDDGSTEPYSAVFNQLSDACKANRIVLRVIRNDTRLGAPAAKNRGLLHCTSDEVLTTDDDILLPPDMVRLCRAGKPIDDRPTIVGPRVIYLLDDEQPDAAIARANAEKRAFFNYKDLTLTPWSNPGKVREYPFVTAVALWPRSLFERGLTFHEGYGGNGYREETDPQLAARASHAAAVFLVPDAVCFHLPLSIAYAKKGGQRRGSRLWFEYWVHRNNATFLNRHREILHSFGISVFGSWVHLIQNRIGPRKIASHIMKKIDEKNAKHH
ncbi:glycosyltransferase family 2 protein [Aquabacterium sp.]|uniref:glycosyltransferase family 2 protein n=1 Tax=Aquabacterium sp. TaxID=1872578 RepID=UPI0035AE4C89